MIYNDNQTVIEFMGKAQKKISELASFVVEREFDCPEYQLLKDLCMYIQCLDDDSIGWTLDEVLDDIDYWNRRADLNTLPFLHIVGYNTSIITGGTGESTSGDPVNFIQLVRAEINKMQHNNLKGLEGGSVGGYYHLTLDEYTKLRALLYPFTPPTVSLVISSTIPSPTNNVYEKGTSITQVGLLGSYVLNGGEQVLETKYLMGSDTLVTYTGNNVDSPFTVTTPIRVNTTFTYSASFKNGGTKTANRSVTFEAPYFHATGKRGRTLSQLATTRVLRSKPSQIDVTYTLPTGNAMSSDPTVMYLSIPKYWGELKKIEVDNNAMFPYLNSWTRTEITRQLADGTNEAYYLYEYKEATEGTFNFNFKF